MEKYPHIKLFEHAIKWAHSRHVNPGVVKYTGTVKLHGTNAGIRFEGDTITAQSRNRDLTLEADHSGFCRFVEERRDVLADLNKALRARLWAHEIRADVPLTLYGEWIGPGILKGAAVSSLPERQWVVFGVKSGTGDTAEHIAVRLPAHNLNANGIYDVTDAGIYSLTVDFRDPASLQAAADKAARLTAEVEERCPWGARFGIEGVGEGIVWTPHSRRLQYTDLWFKTKGARHQRNPRDRKPKVRISPEVASSIEAFADMALTPERLEQGITYLEEMGKPVDRSSTGPYLKWLGNDIQRECADELEASGLEWRQVAKPIAGRARDWFFEQCTQAVFAA